ncbi:hypothetical protein EYF88_05125 [Paracoccus sediminis]|uniref:HupE / UreJ protein n=1 Tax=Paracoccus sediminis TaxID=1214787 RepID=A0A238VN44_9RHOB|nr:hypothetical protein [Paracoccus sediminis]TBN52274.1 hypothetical protein EYF88_05125 [Paracoccus sediminis]SNR35153.1 hypothetical protein SAMN06265378_102402 [Paracoccus sediminis]
MKPYALAAALMIPQAVLAHPGDHGSASPVHLLSQADHLATLAMIIALGMAAWLFLRGRP